jgi:hypothetical protein
MPSTVRARVAHGAGIGDARRIAADCIMAEDDDHTDDTGPLPEEIALAGEGPFQLPLCTDLVAIAIGETLAVLQFETMEGQRLDIPIPLGMLAEIKDASEEALQVATTTRDGTMVQ